MSASDDFELKAKLEQNIRDLEEKKSKAETKLEVLRDDFAVVEDQIIRLAQIVNMLDNNTDSLDLLRISKEKLDEFGINDEVMTGLSKVVKIEDLFPPGDLANKVGENNYDFIDEITKIGISLDKSRTSLASLIKTEVDIINDCDSWLPQQKYGLETLLFEMKEKKELQ